MYRERKSKRLKKLKKELKKQTLEMAENLSPEEIYTIYNKQCEKRKEIKKQVEEFQGLPTTLPEYEAWCG